VDITFAFFRAREKNLADSVDRIMLSRILVSEIATIESGSVPSVFAGLEKTKFVHFVF